MRQRSRCFVVLISIFLLSFVGIAAAFYQGESSSDLVKAADEMVQHVARLRMLEPKAAISKGVKTREEISQFINEHVRSNYEEGELKREGKLLKKLGLVPDTMDYKDFVLKLLTEQVGGYYDPDKKTFFIAGWLPVEQQKPVMVHELTHALQDQYFDINRFLKEDRKLHNDDRILAHQALFEGDAMAVMLDYILEPAKRTFAQLPDLVFVMRAQLSTMESQYAVFKSAPDYLKETLLFPYGYGAAFLQKVRAKDPWSAVDKIYSDLPVSTEQVIHPEKYLNTRDDPKPVQSKDLVQSLGAGWQVTYQNVLGEFTLFVMLKSYLQEDQSKRASAGWGGDQVLLLEENDGARSAVYFTSLWDAPEDAQEFFEASKGWLQKRYPRAQNPKEAADTYSLNAEGEYHAIRRDGSGVRLILGLPDSLSSKLKDW